jgi:peroxiredoxin Q/BCP
MIPKQGEMAPELGLPDQNGVMHSLAQYRGQWVVVYFYPKDDTPGCTVEACSFRDSFAVFRKASVVVLGVSADPIKKHEKFAEKFSLPFPLLSDETKEVCERYGVWAKKKFMGREYMGINRTTFLIDKEGRIAKVYEKVKPDHHAEAILFDKENLE